MEMGCGSDAYLTCVEHDFGFNVISLLIHHVYFEMELSAEFLHIYTHKTHTQKLKNCFYFR